MLAHFLDTTLPPQACQSNSDQQPRRPVSSEHARSGWRPSGPRLASAPRRYQAHHIVGAPQFQIWHPSSSNDAIVSSGHSSSAVSIPQERRPFERPRHARLPQSACATAEELLTKVARMDQQVITHMGDTGVVTIGRSSPLCGQNGTTKQSNRLAGLGSRCCDADRRDRSRCRVRQIGNSPCGRRSG